MLHKLNALVGEDLVTKGMTILELRLCILSTL